jgi:hypothetical protein
VCTSHAATAIPHIASVNNSSFVFMDAMVTRWHVLEQAK